MRSNVDHEKHGRLIRRSSRRGTQFPEIVLVEEG
jgi:hypothetical protein